MITAGILDVLVSRNNKPTDGGARKWTDSIPLQNQTAARITEELCWGCMLHLAYHRLCIQTRERQLGVQFCDKY